MIMQEPKITFVGLQLTDTIATSVNITFCERPSETNISNPQWCLGIQRPNATHEEWCTTFYCQTDTSNENNDVWDL